MATRVSVFCTQDILTELSSTFDVHTHELFFLSGYPDVPLVVSEEVKGFIGLRKGLKMFCFKFVVFHCSQKIKSGKS